MQGSQNTNTGVSTIHMAKYVEIRKKSLGSQKLNKSMTSTIEALTDN
jgi:hypothetical protein